MATPLIEARLEEAIKGADRPWLVEYAYPSPVIAMLVAA
jgi:hypothetical protein